MVAKKLNWKNVSQYNLFGVYSVSMRGMTGFSYISELTEYGRVAVSLKTLNSRFFEVKLVLPPVLQSMEPFLRKVVRNNFKRGRVEMVVDFLPNGVNFEVEVDGELARKYFLSLKKLSNYLGLLPDIEIVDIARMPNVVNLVRLDPPPSLVKQVQSLVERAVEDVVRQRIEDGNETKKDVLNIISKIKSDVSAVRSRWEEINSLVEEKVREKVEKFLKEYENRKEVDTAMVSFLVKIDINEEIFRFTKHLEALERLLDQDGEVGKKAEFIIQEMSREVNTIASKSFDYVISSLVVEIKASLEKIREHVQNIE